MSQLHGRFVSRVRHRTEFFSPPGHAATLGEDRPFCTLGCVFVQVCLNLFLKNIRKRMPAENALVGEKSTVQDNQCEERTKKRT